MLVLLFSGGGMAFVVETDDSLLRYASTTFLVFSKSWTP